MIIGRGTPCGCPSWAILAYKFRCDCPAFHHESVSHSVSEYVRDQALVNGLESFWASLKRGYHGTYHHMSPKHLGRYINEYAGRHNDRPSDTIDHMAHMVRAMEGKQSPYKELTAGGPAYPESKVQFPTPTSQRPPSYEGGLFDLHSCISQPRFGDYIHDQFVCITFSGLPKRITNLATKRHNLIENCYRM